MTSHDRDCMEDECVQEFNDISYSYITNTNHAYYGAGEDDFRIKALAKLAELPQGNQPLQESDIESCLFSEEDVLSYLQRFPPTMDRMAARGENPLSDYDKDDKAVTTTFPHIFMLGVAYKRQPGRLSTAQRSHLLNQFHQCTAKDRRLLGFFFDVGQRQQVVDGVKSHVEGNRKSLKVIAELLNNGNSERERLKSAIQFPYTRESKRVLNRYLPHLLFPSKSIPYSALEGTNLKHRLLGTSYRYSAPTCFLTISPGTVDNPRSVRLAFSTKSNEEFPSVFEEECPYGSNGADFADAMMGTGSRSGESGSSPAIIAEATVRLPKSKRAEMSIENPVAFVHEYKILLNDILTILIGVNIEGKGYYSKLDCRSRRRTTYYKLRKGIFGHAFSATGVTEAHERGTLHWHFIVYAGLSPFILQRFAHLQEICDEISAVLDTMYVSEAPADLQVGSMLRRFLKTKKASFLLSDSILDSIEPKETLLERKDPTNKLSQPFKSDDELSETGEQKKDSSSGRDIQRDVEMEGEECSQICGRFSPPQPPGDTESIGSFSDSPANHLGEENGSCFANSSSEYDSPCTDGIVCDGLPTLGCNDDDTCDSVKLVSSEQVNRVVGYQATNKNFHSHQLTCHKGSQGKIGCRLCCPSALIANTSAVKLSQREKVCTNQAPDGAQPREDRPRVWNSTPPTDQWGDNGSPKHHLVDVLAKSKPEDSVIVWETKRPEIPLGGFALEPMDFEDPRAFIVKTFRELLGRVPNYGKDNNLFWNWMQSIASVDQLVEIFLHVREKLPASNGFIAAFNPVLALCTGSHNNASLLGSIGQAKSALFYLIPYQGKTKFPLMSSLTLIDHAINHIEKYPSRASDSGTMQRTVKHLLQRVINRIHLHIEISDYQIAAALLELPSMITSDTFAYGNPLSIRALKAKMDIEDLEQISNQLRPDARQAGNQVQFPITTVQDMQQLMQDDLDDVEGQSFPSVPDNANEIVGMNNDVNAAGGEGVVADESALDPSMLTTNPSLPDPGDILHGLGYIQKINTVLSTKDQKAESVFVPATALYLYRNRSLHDLNYYEYMASLSFVNKKPRQTECNLKDVHAQEHFPLEDGFIAPHTCYHVIGHKLRTPLIIGKLPRHPGKLPPPSVPSKLALAWRSKADFFAKFYLSLFRPEHASSSYEYTWEHLQSFVAQLQNDSSIISKFRLMVMHQHMSGMKTSEVVKKMTLQYRGRNRDLWTRKQRLEFQKWNIHNDTTRIDTRQPFDEKYRTPDLPQATMNRMYKRLNHDTMQIRAVGRGNVSNPRQGDNGASVSAQGNTVSSYTVSELQICYDDMVSWKRTEEDHIGNGISGSVIRGIGSSLPLNPTNAQKKRAIAEIRSLIDTRPRGELNQQLQLYNAFADSLLKNKPLHSSMPSLVLVHGPPGVGKSHIRKSISDAIAASGGYNDNTAFNSINAIDMEGGCTTCTDTGFNCKYHFNHVGTFLPLTVRKAREKIGSCASVDVTNHIDEIGTQAPAHLARKDALCKLLSTSDDPFGGRQTNLYGDLTQLGPVKAGLSLTQAVMDVFASKSIRSKIVMPGKKKKSPTSMKNGARTMLSGEPKYQPTHPYLIGTKLMTSVRWFELTQQQRAVSDPIHSRFVEKLYKGFPLTQMDLKSHYKLFTPEEAISEEWIRAPVIVATNRERITLIEERAQLFAKFYGTHVIRWPRDKKDWEQQPPDVFRTQAEDDPVFWEYFVFDAPGFLNETIQRDLQLVNALPIKCYDVRFSNDMESLLSHLKTVVPVGEVIDMPIAPECVVVELMLPHHVDAVVLKALQEMSLERPKRTRNNHKKNKPNRILLPLRSMSCSWDSTPTVIRGSHCFLPSRAVFRNLYPFELGFAITVHKSQGKTLDRVIIALSSCGLHNCQFTFQQLLVAFSRVRCGSHIRLLLTGRNEEEKWRSILFVNNLRRDPSIDYFFAGFREQPNHGDMNESWMEDVWCHERANRRFEEMIDSGKFN
ncbi:Inherit from euNOG: Conserved hypothetical protein [Seminavis robusta]|uniref:ATP-dependent DNA helicase n=1 Tax=Seminavis robusta TaxID=568900 RepID=A0A9N8DVJ7_9STRA|nr:Inherit from euNOG: Conserved hypothetical protein [Seminavis robusta]|eukprot:Sro404_g135910.1 Inherit from euNOG: Conserved hypothetical protein (1979) ;mRNA; f:27785-33721